MTIWRKLLTALKDDRLDEAERDVLLAQASVRIAADRCAPTRRPTADEVVTVAREEFAALIDPGQARAALATWGRGDG
ncbi:hypothetical protein ACN6LI_008104 [Streptomyces violaceoruber]